MAMVVKNNMSAVRTLNTLNQNSSALQKSLAKVSSGMKINSAQDDASGYAISERMRVQIRSLDQANQNTQNASSLMKTAEGAVSSTMEILKTLKEKAINAATDTNTDSDRATIQKELNQYIDQIDDNALTTFNGKYLVDGSKSQYGHDTYTAMTNQSLSTNTDGATKLVELENRNGESLEIKNTDYITASYVKDGKTYTTKFGVKDNTTLENVFEELNKLETDDTTGAAVPAFGAAQTSTSTMDTAEATNILNALSGGGNDVAASLYKVANDQAPGVNDADGNAITAQQVKDAISTINKASGESAVLRALGVQNATSYSDAKTKLQTAIGDVYDATSLDTVSIANSSTSNDRTVSEGTTVSATFSGGTTYDADGSADATSKVNVNMTATFSADATAVKDDTTAFTSGTDFTVAASPAKAAFVSAAMTSIDNIAAQQAASGGTFATSIGTAAANATTLTAPTTGTAGTDPALHNNLSVASVAGTAGTALSATDAAVKDYGIAYAYNAMGGGGGELVLGKSTAIGLKSSGDLQSTADGEFGVTVTAAKEGIKGQISGLTLSITDSEGNVKKSANAALDAFKTQVYAKNHSDPNEMTFQVGANANQAITVGLDDMRSEALGLKGADGSKVSVATQDKANAAVAVFDNAIQKVLDQQATIGAIESRLEYTSQNLTTSSENVQAAESTIRDADMAKEMTNYTKNNVLLQAAQSMLAQANQNSSAVLSLLQ